MKSLYFLGRLILVDFMVALNHKLRHYVHMREKKRSLFNQILKSMNLLPLEIAIFVQTTRFNEIRGGKV